MYIILIFLTLIMIVNLPSVIIIKNNAMIYTQIVSPCMFPLKCRI